MSDFLQSPTTRPQLQPDPARTLEMLATLFLIAFVVTTLYVGRNVLIPIAVAILVSFVLSPPILLLRRWGLGRLLSVVIIVLLALGVAFTTSTLLTRQVSELVVDLPNYQATINEKIERLSAAAADNPLFGKVSQALQAVIEPHPRQTAPSDAPARENRQKGASGASQNEQPPIPVEIRQPSKGPFALAQTIAGSALSPLETTAIVVVFVIFILLQREDLRNRFIKLAGADDLQRTTLAMNDAAARLSRFFLTQTLVNASFGVIVAIGLYAIGLPSPILWGMSAFLLRFVPYIGSFIAAAFPIALAAAIDPGWGMALATAALFLIVEPIIGNAVEPWLYGRNTGLSPIAVVIAATFWTAMWGPIGLVLSTPLTVCLVVLGRHVERLRFLEVIFGDAPPLTPTETFYQRLLVGDASEIADQAEAFLQGNSFVDYCDSVALPALSMAQTDLRRGVLDMSRQNRMQQTIDELIDDLADQADEIQEPATRAQAELHAQIEAGERSSPAPTGPSSESGSSLPAGVDQTPAPAPNGLKRHRIVCIGGYTLPDEAAAALFAQVLEKHDLAADVQSAATLTVGRISRLAETSPQIVCLSFFDADLNVARARFAVRRLRRRLGDTKVLAGFWRSDPARLDALCAGTKADFCATSFKDALDFCLKEADRNIESVSPPASSSNI
ncbi:AI-2E family transporter [Methylocapsa acidiphila]|uniref:AI-2E family transporter n=1 Tax=Methylocapsa acidiphila TaxID=133552 RepID=UPI000685AE37|nr:AI-2E family transporter [Methylocapsa acidiphila]